MNSRQLLEDGFAFHQAGRAADAERLYSQILAANPRDVDACNLLGILRAEQGRTEDALELIGAALCAEPQSIGTLCNYGLVLRGAGRLDEALAIFDRARAIQPDSAAVLDNRGGVLFLMGRHQDALDCYDTALGTAPDNAGIYYNRGMALGAMDRFADAAASYERALAVHPNYVEALANRSVMMLHLKRFAEALANSEAALGLRPNHAEAWHNRAMALQGLKRVEEAGASFDRAIALRPGYAEAWYGRGNILKDMDRLDAALDSYDRALAAKPNFPAALHSRSAVHWTMGRYEPALDDAQTAFALDPDFAYAPGTLLHFKMYGGDWRDFERDKAALDDGVRAGKRVAEPFVYQAVSGAPADLQACAKIHADDRYPAMPALWMPTDRRNAKIRVGYLSGEFREHVTAQVMAGLYERHDKTKFEIVAFDNGARDDSPIHKRLEAAFDTFVDISKLSDYDAAKMIADEKIDILVNINGYSGAHRMGVFAHRPAPVQVNYIGFPGTLGANYIDYILADRFVIPEQDRRHYTEQVVYLPDCYHANDPRRVAARPIPARMANGLPENGFIFCNFNQSYKLTPPMFAAWMRILARAEGSVLWLPESNAQFPVNLRRAAKQHGVSGERICFAPRVSLDDHFARLELADLFLDSLPHNAHTTASDALWAGLPVLTCPGQAFPGRVAASLLHAIGLPELVCETPDAYEALAVKLSGDPMLLKTIREKLKSNRDTTPLFDIDRSRRSIETAFETMWHIHARGESPRSFDVRA